MLGEIAPQDFRWGDYRRYTFSLGIDAGDELVLSGHTAAYFDAGQKRMVVPDDVAEQADVVYDKIAAILAARDSGLDDVDHVVEYVTAAAAEDYVRIGAVRQERLGAAEPAVTTLCVDRLLRPQAHIEIAVRTHRAPGASPVRFLSPIHSRDARDLPFAGQVEFVLDRADEVLAAQGRTWDDVVFAMEHVAVDDGRPLHDTALDRVDRIGERRIAGVRVGMERLVPKGALVQLDLSVSEAPVEVVAVDEGRAGPAALAEAVRVGNRLYISGQSGVAGTAGAGIGAEAAAAYRRLLELLDAGGAQPEDLVETVEYVTHAGLDGYGATSDVRRELLPRPYAAATGTVCRSLDGQGTSFVVYGTAMVR